MTFGELLDRVMAVTGLAPEDATKVAQELYGAERTYTEAGIRYAAESMGLGSVVLGLPREAFQGEKAPRLRQELHVPDGYDFVIALAVGVPADDKPAHPVGENKITIIG